MEESVLFNQACELRSQRRYAEGFKILQRGYEQNDPYCIYELGQIYHSGGWGFEPNKIMFESLQEKLESLNIKKPIGIHSYCEMQLQIMYAVKFKNFFRMEKSEFIQFFEICERFAKKLSVFAIGLFKRSLAANKHLKYIDNPNQYKHVSHSLFLNVADQKNALVKQQITSMVYCKMHPVEWIEGKLHIKSYFAIRERLRNNDIAQIEIYTIGRLIYENRLFQVEEAKELARNALKIYVDVSFRFKRSIITWLLVAKELRIVKDIYVFIGKIAHNMMRSKGAWGREEEEAIKKIKI